MLRRVAAFALLAAAAAVSLRAAGPQFWRLEGASAFLEGEIEGLSLDSDGRLRLGVAPRRLFDPEAPNAWCVARDGRGVLYVGTGNDGRVLRVEGEKGSVLFDPDELEVHAVAVGPDGRVYAGSSPDGAVYAIDAAGKATRFFDPDEKYVWALAFDEAGALYVATGGEGRVYRVTPDGKPQTVLTTTETHVLSLALDGRGKVYAGSSPEGIVYRIDAPGKAFVVLDSAFREIKALDLGPDGSVYAAAIDGQTAETARPAASPAASAPAPAAGAGNVVAEVTVTESYSVVVPAAPVTAGTEAAPGPPKGALLRIRPSGDVDTLWSSAEDVPHAAVRTGAGVLVGTGNKGKVYRVGDDARWALVASLPAEQVTALLASPGGGAALVTSNPARVFSIDGGVRRAGNVRLEGQGHGGGLDLGPRLVGGHGAAGDRGTRPDSGGQYRDSRRDMDRLVGAVRPPRRPADGNGEGALPPAQGHPGGRRHGRDPHGRSRGRRLPAAEPAAGREVDHGAPRRRGIPEADLGQRRARDPRPGDGSPQRARRVAAGPRGQPARRQLQPQALPARPAHLLVAGRGSERRPSALLRRVPGRGRRAVATAARGPHRAGLRLGNGERPQRALRRPDPRLRRAGEPSGAGARRVQGHRLLRGRQRTPLDRGLARPLEPPADPGHGAGRREPGAPPRDVDRRGAVGGGPSQGRNRRLARGDLRDPPPRRRGPPRRRPPRNRFSSATWPRPAWTFRREGPWTSFSFGLARSGTCSSCAGRSSPCEPRGTSSGCWHPRPRARRSSARGRPRSTRSCPGRGSRPPRSWPGSPHRGASARCSPVATS